MKKLFIGCGLLLVLGLGTLGYVTWQVWPELTSFIEQGEEFERRIQQLEADHPFDPEVQDALDTQRFVQFLELRVDVKEALLGLNQQLQGLDQRVEEDDVGVIEAFKLFLGMQGEFYKVVLPPLEQRGMGLAEAGWYSRVFWATLQNIDSGGAADEEQLNALRGYFAPMRSSFDELRNGKGLSLTQLLGDLDPALVGTARDLLATDIDRVMAGIQEPDVDALTLLIAVGGFDDGRLGLEIEPEDQAGDGSDAEGR